MSAADIATGLAGYTRRGPGTDAERRAAAWLATEIDGPRRDATIERFWCRPGWALAHAWHAALALAASVVIVSDATAGGIVALAALACVVLDATTGRSPGRRLTPERASQNVVSDPADARRPTATTAAVDSPTVEAAENPTDDPADARTLLLVTAPYDAGRNGLVTRPGARRVAARARRRLALDGRLTPGWLGWLSIAIATLVAVAVVRRTAGESSALTIVQAVATIALLLALAALVQLAAAPIAPHAPGSASAAAVAVALTRALDAAPPANLEVRLVLQGASDGTRIGLARHLRAHRAPLRARSAIVLGIGPALAGPPRWWHSDGPLVPLAYRRRLRDLAAAVAAAVAENAGDDAARPRPERNERTPTPYRGRGTAPAFPARLAGLPAIAIGTAPRAPDAPDPSPGLDPAAIDRLLGFALTLVDALDETLAAERAAAPRPAPVAE